MESDIASDRLMGLLTVPLGRFDRAHSAMEYALAVCRRAVPHRAFAVLPS